MVALPTRLGLPHKPSDGTSEPYRKWTYSITGNCTEARLLEANDHQCILEKQDGMEMPIRMTLLSESDRYYVENTKHGPAYRMIRLLQ